MFMFLRFACICACFLGLIQMGSRGLWRRGKRVALAKGGVDVNILRGKYNRLNGATITVDLPGRLDFNLRAERWFDRIAKSLGLAREWQTGDGPFDARIYITCDDPLVQGLLSTDHALHATLSKLLSVKGRSVTSARGRLWIQCGPEDEARELSNELLRQRFANTFGTDLQSVRERLLPHAGSEYERVRDPTITPRRWLSGIAAVLALLGIVGGIYQISQVDKQVVHVAVASLSGLFAVGVGMALLLTSALLLGGTSSAQRVLLEIVLAALPGLWLAAGGALDWYNEHLDSSPPSRYSVRVGSVYKTRSKSHWTYHLVVASWPDARAERKVTIDQRAFELMTAGGCVDVIWRRGKLGDGWIEGYERNTTNTCEGTFVE